MHSRIIIEVTPSAWHGLCLKDGRSVLVDRKDGATLQQWYQRAVGGPKRYLLELVLHPSLVEWSITHRNEHLADHRKSPAFTDPISGLPFYWAARPHHEELRSIMSALAERAMYPDVVRLGCPHLTRTPKASSRWVQSVQGLLFKSRNGRLGIAWRAPSRAAIAQTVGPHPIQERSFDLLDGRSDPPAYLRFDQGILRKVGILATGGPTPEWSDRVYIVHPLPEAILRALPATTSSLEGWEMPGLLSAARAPLWGGWDVWGRPTLSRWIGWCLRQPPLQRTAMAFGIVILLLQSYGRWAPKAVEADSTIPLPTVDSVIRVPHREEVARRRLVANVLQSIRRLADDEVKAASVTWSVGIGCARMSVVLQSKADHLSLSHFRTVQVLQADLDHYLHRFEWASRDPCEPENRAPEGREPFDRSQLVMGAIIRWDLHADGVVELEQRVHPDTLLAWLLDEADGRSLPVLTSLRVQVAQPPLWDLRFRAVSPGWQGWFPGQEVQAEPPAPGACPLCTHVPELTRRPSRRRQDAPAIAGPAPVADTSPLNRAPSDTAATMCIEVGRLNTLPLWWHPTEERLVTACPERPDS